MIVITGECCQGNFLLVDGHANCLWWFANGSV